MIRTIIKLAVFALVCALFFAYLAFTIGNIHPFAHSYKLAADFDDPTGLLKDDLANVAGSLAARDQAIGRLIENFDTVTGAVNERDAQIRTVLDNLLAIARTFSANTGTLDQAVTDLGAFSDNLGTLLANNRDQIDRIIANLNVVTDEVRAKLPTLDHLLAGVDEGVKRLFNASRYGEWLNQVIPCGAIGNPPVVQVNDPCVTGLSSVTAPETGAAAGASAL